MYDTSQNHKFHNCRNFSVYRTFRYRLQTTAMKPIFINRRWPDVVATHLSPYETMSRHVRYWKWWPPGVCTQRTHSPGDGTPRHPFQLSCQKKYESCSIKSANGVWKRNSFILNNYRCVSSKNRLSWAHLSLLPTTTDESSLKASKILQKLVLGLYRTARVKQN
jgi:hypothetical protein